MPSLRAVVCVRESDKFVGNKNTPQDDQIRSDDVLLPTPFDLVRGFLKIFGNSDTNNNNQLQQDGATISDDDVNRFPYIQNDPNLPGVAEKSDIFFILQLLKVVLER